MTQDDKREIQVCDLCGLLRNDSRIEHDAIHPILTYALFELKSVTANKGVSTARQVHIGKIGKWRTRYWIVSKGKNTDDGMDIAEMYIHHPSTLEPFFSATQGKVEASIRKGMELVEFAKKHGFEGDTSFVENLIEVGSRKDDPTISMKLVRSGTPLPFNDPELTRKIIAEFILQNPIGENESGLAA